MDWSKPEAICAFAKLYPDKAPAILFPWTAFGTVNVGVPRKLTMKFPITLVQCKDSAGAVVPNKYAVGFALWPTMVSAFQYTNALTNGAAPGVPGYIPAAWTPQNLISSATLLNFCDSYQINAMCLRLLNNTPGATSGASAITLQRSYAEIVTGGTRLDVYGIDPVAREVVCGPNSDTCVAWKQQSVWDPQARIPTDTPIAGHTGICWSVLSSQPQDLMAEVTVLWQFRPISTNAQFITPVQTTASVAGVSTAVQAVSNPANAMGNPQTPMERESTISKVVSGLGLAYKNFQSGNWMGLIGQGVDLIKGLFTSSKVAHLVRRLEHDPELEEHLRDAVKNGEVPSDLAELWLKLNQYEMKAEAKDGEMLAVHIRLPSKSIWTRKYQNVSSNPFMEAKTDRVTLLNGRPLLEIVDGMKEVKEETPSEPEELITPESLASLDTNDPKQALDWLNKHPNSTFVVRPNYMTLTANH
jgi:hypothetical protein